MRGKTRSGRSKRRTSSGSPLAFLFDPRALAPFRGSRIAFVALMVVGAGATQGFVVSSRLYYLTDALGLLGIALPRAATPYVVTGILITIGFWLLVGGMVAGGAWLLERPIPFSGALGYIGYASLPWLLEAMILVLAGGNRTLFNTMDTLLRLPLLVWSVLLFIRAIRFAMDASIRLAVANALLSLTALGCLGVILLLILVIVAGSILMTRLPLLPR